jgi:hypothetical protein
LILLLYVVKKVGIKEKNSFAIYLIVISIMMIYTAHLVLTVKSPLVTEYFSKK